jgi:hypothetical protein
MRCVKPILFACLAAACCGPLWAQDVLALVHRRSGDTLRIHASRIVQVETANLALIGSVVASDSVGLAMATRWVRNGREVDTVITVPRAEVLRLGYCRATDPRRCAGVVERRERDQRWTAIVAVSAMVAGGVVAASGDGPTGGALALAGGLFYAGAVVLNERPVRKVRPGRRWRWA